MRPQVSRRLLLGGVMATVGTAPTASAQIVGAIRAAIPGGGFSVSGRRGPFIRQVANRKVEPGASAQDPDSRFGFSSIEAQGALLPMPQTQARIEAMIATLAAHWPYAQPPRVVVHMTCDAQYSPAALGDGSIAIPVGFLEQAETDDEVAYILGHEFSHVALGHFTRNDRLKLQRKLFTRLAQVYNGGVALSQVRVQQAGENTRFTVDDRRKIEAARTDAVRSKQQLDWVLNVGVGPMWSRRHEDEADALGYDLAQAIGRNASDGAAAAFSRLENDHKLRDEMITQLQAQIEESLVTVNTPLNAEAAAAGNINPLINAFSTSFVAGLKERAQRALEKFLSSEHRPVVERIKGISEYSDTAYPSAGLGPEVTTTWLRATKSSPEFVAARTAVTALRKSRVARAKNDFPAADAEIRRALATQFGRLPVFLNEAARIALGRRDFRAAEAQFTRADAHPEQTLDGFRDHVQMCIDQAAYPRGLAVIEIYKARFKTDKDLLPELIRIKFKQGKTEEAIALLQRCVAYEEPAMTAACSLRAIGPGDAAWEALPEAERAKIDRATSRTTTLGLVTGGFGEMLKGFQER